MIIFMLLAFIILKFKGYYSRQNKENIVKNLTFFIEINLLTIKTLYIF